MPHRPGRVFGVRCCACQVNTGYVRAHGRPYWKPFCWVNKRSFQEAPGYVCAERRARAPVPFLSSSYPPFCPSGRRKCSPKFWRAFPIHESQIPSSSGRRKRSPIYWRALPVKSKNHKLRSKPSENARKNRACIFLGPEMRMKRTKARQNRLSSESRELARQIDI
jgi:hypothetical protein